MEIAKLRRKKTLKARLSHFEEGGECAGDAVDKKRFTKQRKNKRRDLMVRVGVRRGNAQNCHKLKSLASFQEDF